MKAKKTPESNRIEELTDEIKKANQETEVRMWAGRGVGVVRVE